MSIEWKDATSYSQGQRGKIEPRSWECNVAGIRVYLTKQHVGYPDSWVMHCRPLEIDTFYMGGTEGVSDEQAQEKALATAAAAAQKRAEQFISFAREVKP